MHLQVNGDDTTLPDGATVATLLERMGVGLGWVVVEHNGEPLERATGGAVVLVEGDVLEVIRAVAGG